MSRQPPASFIAVDWGTTNRRAYLIDQGRVAAVDVPGRGAKQADRIDYPSEIAAIRERLGCHPVLCAGMAGSSIGWREVPYVPVPVSIDGLAAAAMAMGSDIWILPGAAQTSPHFDVMRGEELQFLGAMSAGAIPVDGLAVQPGTHSKWARLENGTVAEFVTVMTGELYQLLADHSILASQLTQPVAPGADFEAGVQEGLDSDLASALFRIRAATLLGGLSAGKASAFASGILIGAEVAARIPAIEETLVHVVGDGPLAALYANAIEQCGKAAILVPGRDAFCSGAHAAWSSMQ